MANALKFGERSKMDRPILEVLRKALLFLILLIVLSVAEEVIVGLFHGRATMTSIGDMADGYLPEAFAIGLLMLLILIPYFAFRISHFAFREIGATLGDGKLLMMLIEPRRQIAP
jgi:flagellar biosynthesis protein FliQ